MSLEQLQSSEPPVMNHADAAGGDLLLDEAVRDQETQVTFEQLEDVVKQFSPHTEVDNSGLTRLIFEQGDKTFTFKGREETPMYPTINTSQPMYLGREAYFLTAVPNKPKLEKDLIETYKKNGVSEDMIQDIEATRVKKWQTEHDRLKGFTDTLSTLQETNSAMPEHFIAEQSAYGIFALMAKLQPENPHWEQQRAAVAASHYDAEALLVIDMATALDSVGIDSFVGDQEEYPPLGEAVVIASLLGDERAQDLSMSAVAAQEHRESSKLGHTIQEATEYAASMEIADGKEAFHPEDLVVVHATRFKPKADPRGYRVQTIHDASGYPRASVHTAINHKVESHMSGNWDAVDYVVVAGFDKMLEANGSPNSINGADTWWTRNPGEDLIFADGTLIAPGENQNDLVVQQENGEVNYKASGFTDADLEAMDQEFKAGISNTIHTALDKGNGSPVSLDSKEGQQIIRNILRDALVEKEITVVRGKQLLQQSDDKFMDVTTQDQLYKMAANLHLGIIASLHNGGSEENDVETVAATGGRISNMLLSDPKIRRVAYASGMMGAGGTARQIHDQYEQMKKDISMIL